MDFYDYAYDVYQGEGEQLAMQFEKATTWLNNIGIPFSKTRFGKYKKIIDNFGNNIKEGSDEQFKETLYEFLNAHSEVTEIVRIHNDISHYDFGSYLDQLEKTMSGQAFRNGSINDQSRDFAFELTMAARFIRGGFKVELNQLADVVAKRNDTPKIFIECKRIKSKKSIAKNVAKANSQLKKRLELERSSKARGLVAINVNDVLNPNNTMIVCNNESQLQQKNSEELDLFAIENQENFQSKKFNKCLGVFCEHISQAYIFDREPNAVANCRGVKFYLYKNKGIDVETINKIAESVTNQNILIKE